MWASYHKFILRPVEGAWSAKVLRRSGGLVNWLRARPWTWHLRPVYHMVRNGQRHPRTGEWLQGGEPQPSRLRALWQTITFPHVHDEGDEA